MSGGTPARGVRGSCGAKVRSGRGHDRAPAHSVVVIGTDPDRANTGLGGRKTVGEFSCIRRAFWRVMSEQEEGCPLRIGEN